MPVVALCSEFSVVRGRTRDEWVHFILAGNRSIFSFGEFLMESDDRFFFYDICFSPSGEMSMIFFMPIYMMIIPNDLFLYYFV